MALVLQSMHISPEVEERGEQDQRVAGRLWGPRGELERSWAWGAAGFEWCVAFFLGPGTDARMCCLE